MNVMCRVIFFYSTLSSDQDFLTRYDQQNPLYAYKATSDLDTLYLHQAMNTKYWPKSRIAMQKEIDDRMEGKKSLSSTTHNSIGQPQYSQKSDNSNGRETSNPLLSKITKPV